MSNIGKLQSLLDTHAESTKAQNKAFIEDFGTKMTEALADVMVSTTSKIKWQSMSALPTNSKIVVLECLILMPVGQKVSFQDKEFVITEENQNQYAQPFAFPVPCIMLEEGTVQELKDYLERLRVAGESSDKDVKFVDEFVEGVRKEFEEKLLNDEKRLDSLTEVTEIGGFSTKGLTPWQIAQLRHYTENPLHSKC
jgi:hypothetical protein